MGGKEDDAYSDWDSDPEVGVEDEGCYTDDVSSDLQLGRIMRKGTAPNPVKATVKRAKVLEPERPGTSVPDKNIDEQHGGFDTVGAVKNCAVAELGRMTYPKQM
ncbi:hypothetical protein DPMN_091339 [Dreissena polymorpha]|uniref:Uncharacterized protein n=1 Tax=Dreissena polymorpha TaxID=45954 RepID=A0A9D4QZ53_DREPO|nr:hypothetical protein DPMN_091339 [Dreissena polymorpha]